jgi:nicotinamide mononucleotide (NMN) deamidase PncC
MAEGVRNKTGADIGIAVTGIAGHSAAHLKNRLAQYL